MTEAGARSKPGTRLQWMDSKSLECEDHHSDLDDKRYMAVVLHTGSRPLPVRGLTHSFKNCTQTGGQDLTFANTGPALMRLDLLRRAYGHSRHARGNRTARLAEAGGRHPAARNPRYVPKRRARGAKIKNALHGTWLGHPLHAALTDIPIGAWSAAMVFDLLDAVTGRSELAVAADSAVTVGVVGALGAAVAGWTDWQHTDPPARRIGLTHGFMNVAGVALFTASLVARKRKFRTLGRILSAAGYAVASVSAQLGGNLVYEQRVGVDHTAGQSFPDDFVAVLAESELPEGGLRRVQHKGGVPILLARRGERIFALAETCSHMGGPLSEGEFIDGSVKCPWHGSRFALEDGRVLDGPAVHPQPAFRCGSVMDRSKWLARKRCDPRVEKARPRPIKGERRDLSWGISSAAGPPAERNRPWVLRRQGGHVCSGTAGSLTANGEESVASRDRFVHGRTKVPYPSSTSA
jgi:nitrite reductase/ring-hydroxylating ferredoxin subunit/uncharacterized membrane protein